MRGVELQVGDDCWYKIDNQYYFGNISDIKYRKDGNLVKVKCQRVYLKDVHVFDTKEDALEDALNMAAMYIEQAQRKLRR